MALVFSSGALRPFRLSTSRVLAACIVEDPAAPGGMTDPDAEPIPGNTPTSGQTIICGEDLDAQGIFAPEASDVTVEVQGPAGGISVTDLPGIVLGDGAVVTVSGPTRPVTTAGDGVVGIQVLSGATITISGVVSTTGMESAGIDTEGNTTLTINDGKVTTEGSSSPAVTVGSGSTVNVTGDSTVATTGDGSDAIALSGENSTISVGSGASVSTTGSGSNPIQVNGANSAVTIDGSVSSAASGAAALRGTAANLVISVGSGGVVSTQGAGASAIELSSTGATITIGSGGEVSIAGSGSMAIVSGRNATVNINGRVASTAPSSQGVVLQEGSSLTVGAEGSINTSGAGSSAVVIDEAASAANVTVNGSVSAAEGQAIVDPGSTNSTVVINGRVAGGSSEPTVALGAGNDTVTVNGSVQATGASPVIDLGAGNDTLTDNSSQTIEGPGLLATGGEGADTLNLNNGKPNDSSRYREFETTNVGVNNNPGDPANGMGSTLNVNNSQVGNRINVQASSQVNVLTGGTIELRPDDAAGNGSGQQGGNTRFDPGATANVQTENRTGVQPTQEFSNTTFADGTIVNATSNFVRGTPSNNPTTGRGEIALQSDFTHRLTTENALRFGAALNALADSDVLSPLQQAALDTLVGQAPNAEEAEAVISQLAGEIRAQAAAGGIQAATLFNTILLPSGTRVDSRRSPISVHSKAGNPLYDTTALGNGAWISGFGGLLDVDADSIATASSSDTYGIAAGYDRAIALGEAGKGVFGLGVGYATTNVDGIRDSADIDTYSIGGYFEGNQGPLSGNIAASYSSQNVSASTGTDSDGSLFAISAEGFYNLRPEADMAVGPLARIGGAFGSYGGFSTQNEVFGVDYNSADVSQLTAGFGVRIGGQTEADVGLAALSLDLLYEAALSDDTVQFDGQLGSSEVSVASPSVNSSGFAVGAEAALAISDRTSVGFRYQGSLGNSIQSHT
ncbi:MAG: autotransporter domain-containing protein, partial [Phormidesmis sp.]